MQHAHSIDLFSRTSSVSEQRSLNGTLVLIFILAVHAAIARRGVPCSVYPSCRLRNIHVEESVRLDLPVCCRFESMVKQPCENTKFQRYQSRLRNNSSSRKDVLGTSRRLPALIIPIEDVTVSLLFSPFGVQVHRQITLLPSFHHVAKVKLNQEKFMRLFLGATIIAKGL
ncbi:hypothetical protein OG21DRAFT_1272388 [Imleria badia]|nr:hypothetical protein OG21DRAFT_1272388 [Imleria badia]